MVGYEKNEKKPHLTNILKYSLFFVKLKVVKTKEHWKRYTDLQK